METPKRSIVSRFKNGLKDGLIDVLKRISRQNTKKDNSLSNKYNINKGRPRTNTINTMNTIMNNNNQPITINLSTLQRNTYTNTKNELFSKINNDYITLIDNLNLKEKFKFFYREKFTGNNKKVNIKNNNFKTFDHKKLIIDFFKEEFQTKNDDEYKRKEQELDKIIKKYELEEKIKVFSNNYYSNYCNKMKILKNIFKKSNEINNLEKNLKECNNSFFIEKKKSLNLNYTINTLNNNYKNNVLGPINYINLIDELQLKYEFNNFLLEKYNKDSYDDAVNDFLNSKDTVDIVTEFLNGRSIKRESKIDFQIKKDVLDNIIYELGLKKHESGLKKCNRLIINQNNNKFIKYILKESIRPPPPPISSKQPSTQPPPPPPISSKQPSTQPPPPPPISSRQPSTPPPISTQPPPPPLISQLQIPLPPSKPSYLNNIKKHRSENNSHKNINYQKIKLLESSNVKSSPSPPNVKPPPPPPREHIKINPQLLREIIESKKESIPEVKKESILEVKNKKNNKERLKERNKIIFNFLKENTTTPSVQIIKKGISQKGSYNNYINALKKSIPTLRNYNNLITQEENDNDSDSDNDNDNKKSTIKTRQNNSIRKTSTSVSAPTKGLANAPTTRFLLNQVAQKNTRKNSNNKNNWN
jgi:hypothetical protein